MLQSLGSPVLDVEAPALDVEAPALDVETSALDVETSALEVEGLQSISVGELECLVCFVFQLTHNTPPPQKMEIRASIVRRTITLYVTVMGG